MSKLSHALQLWLEDGHTQTEFAKATGIDQGTTNRLFNGERGLSLKQRSLIYLAFGEQTNAVEALGWIVADLRDNLPPPLEKHISVQILEVGKLREGDLSRKARAKAEFIALLEADDPSALDLVLSLYKWKHGK